MFTVIVPIPYGCLDSNRLSQASKQALLRALNLWNKPFSWEKPNIVLALGSFKDEYLDEMRLKKELVKNFLTNKEGELKTIFLPPARDEEDFALKLRQELEELRPIANIMVYAEKTHALTLKPIFHRRFGKLAQFRTFKSDFEPSHPWILTFTPVWYLRNRIMQLWFWLKSKLSRNFRKVLHRLFR